MSDKLHKDEPIECVAEVMNSAEVEAELCPEDRRVGIAKPRANVQVVETQMLRETDFVWNEDYQAYFPVYGSTHGQREIDRRTSRTLTQPQRRKLGRSP